MLSGVLLLLKLHSANPTTPTKFHASNCIGRHENACCKDYLHVRPIYASDQLIEIFVDDNYD